MRIAIKNFLSHGSLFAGIGGLCTSFNELGFNSLFVNELDPMVIDVYKKNYASKSIFAKSIQQVHAHELPTVDIMHGGFPCQSFSIAGNRRGFEDDRGKLFFEITRLINEFGNSKPKVIVLENSANLLTGAGGMWFRKIKHEFSRLGYWFDDVNAVVLNVAKHTGIPQSRERLFMIGLNSDYFDSNPICQSQFEKVHLQPMSKFLNINVEYDSSYYLNEDNKFSRMIMEYKNDDPYQIYQLRKYEVRAPRGMCPTLTANMGMGGHNVPFVIVDNRVRKLTERECLNLQGFSENFFFPESTPRSLRYKMIGNSVSPPISKLIAAKVKLLLEEEFLV